jgi:hypothetical protein
LAVPPARPEDVGDSEGVRHGGADPRGILRDLARAATAPSGNARPRSHGRLGPRRLRHRGTTPRRTRMPRAVAAATPRDNCDP